MLCLCRGGWRGKGCSHVEALQGLLVARTPLLSCMFWFDSALGERGTWDALGEKPDRSSLSPCVAVTCCRLSTAGTGAQQAWAAPRPAWDPGLHSSGSPQFPQTSPGHPPAPQPAPFPKLRQPFLHVTFQSLQVTVLSSKAPGSLSSFGGCSSHVRCARVHVMQHVNEPTA